MLYAFSMNDSYSILINNIKNELRLRGWSQSKLGEEAEVSQERISNLLNGKTGPTLLLADKLANALNISTVELLSERKAEMVVNEQSPAYRRNNTRSTVFTKYGKTSKAANVSIDIPNLDKFRDEFMAFNFDRNNPKSGKPSSYSNYMEYLLQNYYDNFSEVIDPLDNQSVKKLIKLKALPGFSDYNDSESRFPSATISAYTRFMEQYS